MGITCSSQVLNSSNTFANQTFLPTSASDSAIAVSTLMTSRALSPPPVKTRGRSKGTDKEERHLSNQGSIHLSLDGKENFDLQMRASLITPDNIQNIGLGKGCSVAVLTLNVNASGWKMNNVAMRNIKINWGDLSIVKQVPEKIFAIFMQDTTTIYAVISPNSPLTSEITMTATCENNKVTVTSKISENYLASQDEINQFKEALQHEKKSSKATKRSRKSSDSFRQSKSPIAECSKKWEFPTYIEQHILAEESMDIFEDSYVREYGIQVKISSGRKRSSKEERNHSESNDLNREDANYMFPKRVNKNDREESNSQKKHSITTLLSQCSYTRDKSPDMDSVTSSRGSKTRRSGISASSLDELVERYKRQASGSSENESGILSHRSSLDSVMLDVNFGRSNIKSPTYSECALLSGCERPLGPTPNSRGDLSSLLKQKISLTSPSSSIQPKQRRPTPAAIHINTGDKKKKERRRKISPVYMKRARKISDGPIPMIPLVEENEDCSLADDLIIKKEVETKRETTYVRRISPCVRRKISENSNDNEFEDDVFLSETETEVNKKCHTDDVTSDFSDALRMINEIKTYNRTERKRSETLNTNTYEQETTKTKTAKPKGMPRRTKSMPLLF